MEDKQSKFRHAKIHGEWTIIEVINSMEFHCLGTDECLKECHFDNIELGPFIESPHPNDKAGVIKQ